MELNFTVAFPLIRKTQDDWFIGNIYDAPFFAWMGGGGRFVQEEVLTGSQFLDWSY